MTMAVNSKDLLKEVTKAISEYVEQGGLYSSKSSGTSTVEVDYEGIARTAIQAIDIHLMRSYFVTEECEEYDDNIKP